MKKDLAPKKSSAAQELYSEISELINNAKRHVVKHANSSLVMLNWHIGCRLHQEILKSKRAEYGKEIIEQVAEKLGTNYGSGYASRSLWKMVQFVKRFPEKEILPTLSAELSWSHFVELLSIDDDAKCRFYTEMCCVEGWSVRRLRERIKALFFERTAIAKQSDELIHKELDRLRKDDILSPDLTFRDPYLLRFAGLPEKHSESDLESAILDDLTHLFYELGADFCFIARQKKMSTPKTDRFLDLLFFNRRMKRLIAIELKTRKFEPADKGQMEWYLKWLDKYERREGEGHPLGIILCADKDEEDVELLELKKTGIHVAQYLLDSLPVGFLEEKLKAVVNRAKNKFSQIEQINEQEK